MTGYRVQSSRDILLTHPAAMQRGPNQESSKTLNLFATERTSAGQQRQRSRLGGYSRNVY